METFDKVIKVLRILHPNLSAIFWRPEQGAGIVVFKKVTWKTGCTASSITYNALETLEIIFAGLPPLDINMK